MLTIVVARPRSPRAFMAGTALALAALALAPLSANAQATKPAAAPAEQVTLSSAGGHVLGNPKAANSLVEYMSYTCPHCAHFEEEAHTPLRKKYVAPGRLSFELRNLVRDPIDFAVALIARCGPRASFFRRHKGWLAAQDEWFGKALSMGRSTQQSWYQGDTNTRVRKIAADLGLGDIARRFEPGLTDAAIDACLINKAEQDKLLAMTRYAAETVKLTGTPGFTLNGKLVAGAADWKALEPALPSR